MAAGSAVDLVVSSGPATVAVPAVAGLSQADAETAITDAGLIVGNVTMQSSTTVPAGDVISQNPTAGTTVAPNSAVDLVVSSGSGSGTDVVTITKAEWDPDKKKLKVQATSSAQPLAVLTVVDFGQMKFKSKKDRYELKVKSVNSSPGTVTVTSSLGGIATAPVQIKD